jgi:hypothetical protein
MPYEHLEKDVALMKVAGLNVERMGESTRAASIERSVG